MASKDDENWVKPSQVDGIDEFGWCGVEWWKKEGDLNELAQNWAVLTDWRMNWDGEGAQAMEAGSRFGSFV
jgi:hypothetical protein